MARADPADDSHAALVVASRVPRTLLAFLTGSALAVAGALIRRSPATRWPTPACWA